MIDTWHERIDGFGAVASGCCAVHCAVCALLPFAFGALGMDFLLGHDAEWAFTLVAVTFASCTLVFSWHRRSMAVSGLLALGIIGLLASRGLEMSAGPEHLHEHHHGRERVATEHEEPHATDHLGLDNTVALAGTPVGVAGGLFLVFGHMLNIRTIRRCRKACCS